MAKMQRIQVILDSGGNLAGAVLVPDELPGKKGEPTQVQTGIQATLGQSVHEIEVSEEVARLEGGEFLDHLSKDPAVQRIRASIPTAGHAQVFVPAENVALRGPMEVAELSAASTMGHQQVTAGQG